MKKIVLVLFYLFVCVIGSYAQDANEKHDLQDAKALEKQRFAVVKKTVADAKAALKTAKNLPNAEAALRKILTDSINKQDVKLHLLLFETIKKQYDQGNEKLFLKQQYDTASLFNMAQRMFYALNELDSIDAKPDKSGKIALKYRKNHASLLSSFYTNLYVGGVYFFNHKKYGEAFSCFDTYLSVRNWPLFSSADLPGDTLRLNHSAYLSLVSGYLQNDFDSALKYSKEALKYDVRRDNTLQCLSEIFLAKGDTLNYVGCLQEGVKLYPSSLYFYPHLVDYYSNLQMFTKALDVTNDVLQTDSANTLFRRTKQTLLLNLGEYDECIKLGTQIIRENDSIPDVYYNIALAYYNQALDIENVQTIKNREKAKKQVALYKQCRPYMEKYRLLAPERKDRWRPVLYNIYLNLNLGKEFGEIESLK